MLPDSVLGLLQLISTREIRLLASVGNVAKKTARDVIANHSKMQTLDDNKDVVNLLGGFTGTINIHLLSRLHL